MRLRWRLVGPVVVAVAGVGYGIAYWKMSQPYKVREWARVVHDAPPAFAPSTAPAPEPRPAKSRYSVTEQKKAPLPLDLAFAQASLELDEKEIDGLIKSMGSSDFAVRERATARLRTLGPEGVPALVRYRNHDDPEISMRVESVIQSFEWMKQGAIVVRTEFGSQATNLGIRPGDVIVKVNQTPVLGRATVSQVTPDEERTLSIWRAGRIMSVKIPPGTIGVYLGNWELAKGGNDQARGLGMFERGGGRPNTIEVYGRLRQARQAGMNDPWTIGLLGCVAAQLMDHAYAMECYRIFRKQFGNCNLSHERMDRLFHNLPFDGPHSAFLLERFRSEAWTPSLYHELEDWFGHHGRNYPMLKQVLGEPWRNADQIDVDARRFDAEARIKMEVMERRWADALRDYDAFSVEFIDGSNLRHACAIMSAIHLGRADRAVEIAAKVLESGKDWPDLIGWLGPDLWYAFTAAGAAGDAAGVERLSKLIRAMDVNTRQRMIDGTFNSAINDVNAAELTLPLIGEVARLPRTGNALANYYALLAACPTTTREAFEREWANRPKDATAAINLGAVNAFLRFGAIERAKEAWDGCLTLNKRDIPPPEAKPLERAIEFASENAKRLAGDWSALRGAIQIIDGVEPGTTWAVRWDGAVLFIDAAGAAHEYAGLPPSPVPMRALRHYLTVGRTSAMFVPEREPFSMFGGWNCQRPCYVLDRAAGKWVDACETEVELDPTIPGGKVEAARAAMFRYVNKTYPLPGGEKRWFVENSPGSMWFEGNLRIDCDRMNLAITDMSAEVGELAGLHGPAEIYQLGRHPSGRGPLIYTNVGLFTRGLRGLERVELPGLKNQNVHMVEMDHERYDGVDYGGTLIGVAPQDGGQVFVMDDDGALHPTRGFCGLGPNDWFANQFCRSTKAQPPVGEVIHRLYLERGKKN